jgi:hypothetical protein
MANPSPKPEGQAPNTDYLFVGKALAVPPEQRVRRRKLVHLDEPGIPRIYWYLTTGLVVAVLMLGLLVGRFLLG